MDESKFFGVLDGLKALDAEMREHKCEKCGKATGGISFGFQTRAQAGICDCDNIFMEASNVERIQGAGNEAGGGATA
jgi:hypothetical protein